MPGGEEASHPVEGRAHVIVPSLLGSADMDSHDDAAKLNSNYRVDLIDENGEEIAIGRFRLHRYGWYRNRLGLAARALKMLQTRRNAGEFLPEKEPVGYQEAYRK